MADGHDEELVACLTRGGVEFSEEWLAWLKRCLLDEEHLVEAWPLGGKRGRELRLLAATEGRLLHLHLQDRTLTRCEAVFLGDIARVVLHEPGGYGWELVVLTAGQATAAQTAPYSRDIDVIMRAWRGVQRLALTARRSGL